MSDNTPTRQVWLCVENVGDGSYAIHGDTGSGGFAEPFWPQLCQFGGWLNHLAYCGWYSISETAPPKVWRQ